MTPIQASKPENENRILASLYNRGPQQYDKPKFDVGNKVRISRIQDTFDKGYEANFSH